MDWLSEAGYHDLLAHTVVVLNDADAQRTIDLLISEPLQPFGLAHWVRRIPPALDMHRFHQVLVAGVRPVVLQEVILGNRPDIAFQARRQGAILQPGIGIAPEIPKMMMRINDR